MSRDLAPAHAAPQHGSGPRPLPLFLALLRRVGEQEPELAARALQGLAAYQRAARLPPPRARPIAGKVGAATLRNCGGDGVPVVLVPSTINPPTVLDLDPRTSLAEAVTPAGRVLLLDWGAAAERSALDLGGHVRQLLVPLLRTLEEPPVLVGYCLGGTLALAAAALTPVRAVATLASPWQFGGYPADARQSLLDLWQQSRGSADRLGVLPIEVLQAAFWSLDPRLTVAKFARLAEIRLDSDEARRFVMVEDWANTGEPLPLPAARELLEDLFAADLPGRGEWTNAGRPLQPPPVPTLHFTAANDRIVPAATTAPGERRSCPAGHVGMIVGRSAPQHLHAPLREWLARLAPRR